MPNKMKSDVLMDLSVKEAGLFCKERELPGLHMERECLVFSDCRELLQLEYWNLEVMLSLSVAKESNYPKPNGFTELVDNLRWHIGNLRDNNEWLQPLDTPY